MTSKPFIDPDEYGKLWFGRGLKRLPKYALIPGNPQRVELMLKKVGRANKISTNAPYPLYIVRVGGTEILLGATGVGSPNAAITVEVLSSLGVTTFIRVGSTGAIQPQIEVGDIIIARGAVRNEGTTTAYTQIQYPASTNPQITLALEHACRRLGFKYFSGIVWTSDALFMKENEYFQTMRRANVLSVEMECSTIFTLCNLKGLKAGAILVVDGNLVTGRGQAGRFDPRLKKKYLAGEAREVEVALDAVRILETSGLLKR